MKCISCGSEILASFKHAIVKNECPYCGGSIMDEEIMALIEDVAKTILSEAVIREETAKNIAMTIVARYDLNIKNMTDRTIQKSTPIKASISSQESEKIKIAPPSAYQQITKEDPVTILEASKIFANQSLNQIDQEKLLEEVVKEKYNLSEQSVLSQEDESEFVFDNDGGDESLNSLSAVFAESGTNSVLEQERLARLAKQQRAFRSGSGGFRRGD